MLRQTWLRPSGSRDAAGGAAALRPYVRVDGRDRGAWHVFDLRPEAGTP